MLHKVNYQGGYVLLYAIVSPLQWKIGALGSQNIILYSLNLFQCSF